MPEEFLTSKEVADLLRVSKKTLQRYCAKRALNYIRIGGVLRFRRTAIDLFIARNEVRGAA